MTPMVSIGSFAFPEPSTYSATTSTVVDSGRNVEGYVIGAVIRDGVSKVSLSWNFISAENWASIMEKFNMAQGGSFYNDVTFFCQDTNSWVTRQMYVSDRTADVFLRDKSGNIRGYTGAAMSLVEV